MKTQIASCILLSMLFASLGGYAQYGTYYYQGDNSSRNSRHLFTVAFKNNTTESFKSRMFYSRKTKKAYLKDGDKIIYPGETQSVSRAVGKRDTSKITGYPNKDVWLFPVIKGGISCYSLYAEKSELYITHFQKQGDSVAYQFSKRDTTDLVLLKMLSDNTKAHTMMVKSLRAKKARKIIGYSAIGSWAAVIIGGALSAVFPPAGYVAVAGVFAILPTTFIAYPIIYAKPENRRMKAIKIYDGIKP